MHRVTGSALALALSISAFLSGGCESEAQCDYDGQTLAQGETIDDVVRQLRCTCTASGMQCEDLPDGARVADGGAPTPPDASRSDAAPERGPDRGAAEDAAPDQGATDAAEPDATPDMEPAPLECPSAPIVDFGDCRGYEGRTCLEGPAFECCETMLPAYRACDCVDERWDCTEHLDACLADPASAACARTDLVCDRWVAARALTDATDEWSGDFDTCDAGDMTEAWRQDALEMLNTLRFIAGVDPVERRPAFDRLAQLCALVVVFHGTEDHHLEEDDQCFSEDAAEGLQGSLIGPLPVRGQEDYMIDFGEQNFASMIHRLYTLAPQLGPVGFGGTQQSGCMWAINGRGPQRTPEFVAWPAPGPFPIDAAFTQAGGWTVQSNVINMAFADVEVRRDGEVLPVETRSLQAVGAAGWGVAWLPVDWALEAGRRYDVTLSNIIRNGERGTLEYTVEPVDCDAR